MATIKIVVRQKPNKDGTLPLCLRITRDRKTSFIHLGYSINECDWNPVLQRVKKSHNNATRLNNLILKKLSEATDSALDAESKSSLVSADAVRNKLKPKIGKTFFPQAFEYLQNLSQSGKYNQYTADKPRIHHFKTFLGDKDIAFSDISVGLIEKFEVYLRSAHRTKYTNKCISERTLVNHLVAIRSVFAHAKKNSIIDENTTPFGKDKIKIRFPETKKSGLEIEEVLALENVKLDNPRHDHARNLWLLSFYFAGMRVSDVFRMKWSDLRNDRLYYFMGKNSKGGSLKVSKKAGDILEKYKQFKGSNDDLVFQELKAINLQDAFLIQRTIAFKTSAIDKILRAYVAPMTGIDKKLTMHIARHTFGNLAGNNISVQMLQKLYRHSSITTTINYQQNFINRETDDALDAVLTTIQSSKVHQS